MPNASKFYLTTPIYYVNARPHLGHTYTTLVADVVARWHRAQGDDTWFLTGTDEHGQKIQRSAKALGRGPQEFTDEVSGEFRALWDRMGLTYDDYIRTTDPRHKRGAQKLFALLCERGFIYKGRYTGQYCVFDELYVDAAPGAPCPDCGRPTETISEENYYFKLSAFESKLDEIIWQPERDGEAPRADQLVIEPATRRHEVLSFVRSGLRDLSVSRTSFDWGIPVLGDEKHIIYVWLDALANYITALGWGSDDANDIARFEKYWPADLHIIGKEISRFHCVYWPAFLLAAGLPLPKTIVAHGWLLFEQSKMSKSRGNIVRTETILDAFGSLKPDVSKAEQDLFAADVLRYFLLREIVFGQDGSFSFDALVQRYNSDLANGYGNLVSRTLTMIEKYFDGVVPPGGTDFDIADAIATTQKQLAELEFSLALESLWKVVSQADGFITANAPWKLGALPDDAEAQAKLASILYAAAENLRVISALLYPVLPDAAAKVWTQLGLGDIHRADLKNLAWGGLKPGTRLGQLGPVFPRADKDLVTRMQSMEEQLNASRAAANAEQEAKAPAADAAQVKTTAPQPRENPSLGPALSANEPPAVATTPPAVPVVMAHAQTAAPSTAPAPFDGKIGIDDFTKVELRVAQIKVAERVPKADKLLRLEVDLGYEQRQILAGIAEFYEPESLIGRKVVIVANLAPRKMRGLESNGMLLAASLEGGKPVLASFLEEVELGARLK
jgi:methionyl-tRNA synthetase